MSAAAAASALPVGHVGMKRRAHVPSADVPKPKLARLDELFQAAAVPIQAAAAGAVAAASSGAGADSNPKRPAASVGSSPKRLAAAAVALAPLVDYKHENPAAAAATAAEAASSSSFLDAGLAGLLALATATEKKKKPELINAENEYCVDVHPNMMCKCALGLLDGAFHKDTPIVTRFVVADPWNSPQYPIPSWVLNEVSGNDPLVMYGAVGGESAAFSKVYCGVCGKCQHFGLASEFRWNVLRTLSPSKESYYGIRVRPGATIHFIAKGRPLREGFPVPMEVPKNENHVLVEISMHNGFYAFEHISFKETDTLAVLAKRAHAVISRQKYAIRHGMAKFSLDGVHINRRSGFDLDETKPDNIAFETLKSLGIKFYTRIRFYTLG
jgi:hypothetical protein